jgi:hypothetical protein
MPNFLISTQQQQHQWRAAASLQQAAVVQLNYAGVDNLILK